VANVSCTGSFAYRVILFYDFNQDFIPNGYILLDKNLLYANITLESSYKFSFFFSSQRSAMQLLVRLLGRTVVNNAVNLRKLVNADLPNKVVFEALKEIHAAEPTRYSVHQLGGKFLIETTEGHFSSKVTHRKLINYGRLLE